MKCYLKCLQCMHLNYLSCLLTVQNMVTISYLFGMLDIHGMWSINDVQFWMFLCRATNLDTKTVVRWFELMDFHKTGELEYSEFYIWICMMIQCKDRWEKQFMLCHLKTLTDIIDMDMSGSLNIPEFLELGKILEYDLATMKRLYEVWDWKLSVDRDKIKFHRIKFLIMCLIDEERGYQARRRLIRWRKWKKAILLRLTKPIFEYTRTATMPAPMLLWEAFEDVPLPTFQKHHRHGCWYYFCWCIWLFLTIPCRIPFWLCWCPWTHIGPLRRSLQRLCRCLCSALLSTYRGLRRAAGTVLCEHRWRDWHRRFYIRTRQLEDNHLFPPESLHYYYRHQARLRTEPQFKRWYDWQRRNVYEALGVEAQPWLTYQLKYEAEWQAKVEKVLPDETQDFVHTGPPLTILPDQYPKEWEKHLFDHFVKRRADPYYKPKDLIKSKDLKAFNAAQNKKWKYKVDRLRRAGQLHTLPLRKKKAKKQKIPVPKGYKWAGMPEEKQRKRKGYDDVHTISLA